MKVWWSWSSGSATKANTNTSPSKAKVIDTLYVWGPDIETAMNKAQEATKYGWNIEGNPAPMTYRGQHGTGVAISKEMDY